MEWTHKQKKRNTKATKSMQFHCEKFSFFPALATVKYSCIYKSSADSVVQHMPNTDWKQHLNCVMKVKQGKPEDAPDTVKCQSTLWYEPM